MPDKGAAPVSGAAPFFGSEAPLPHTKRPYSGRGNALPRLPGAAGNVPCRCTEKRASPSADALPRHFPAGVRHAKAQAAALQLPPGSANAPALQGNPPLLQSPILQAPLPKAQKKAPSPCGKGAKNNPVGPQLTLQDRNLRGSRRWCTRPARRRVLPARR